MQMIKYRPMTFIKDVQNEINQLFHKHWLHDDSGSTISQWCPQVDVKEENAQFVVIADLPGIEPKDIEVSIDNNVLSLKGERKLERNVKEQDYSLIERSAGTFYRRFTLPKEVKGEQIQAKYKSGVLTITIPKKEQHTAKKIEIEEDNSLLENKR